jgi:integrase
VQLRVQDLDFARGDILVRAGKGDKDRHTTLPKTIAEPLNAHLKRVKQQWRNDQGLAEGGAEAAGGRRQWDSGGGGQAGVSHVPVRIPLPGAIARKYVGAERQWSWWWVFPAARVHTDQAGGRWRFHVHPTAIQRAFKQAVQRSGSPSGRAVTL